MGVDDVKNAAYMPCARSSLLYGIGGGLVVGCVHFLTRRRVASASNWAVVSFGGISIASWEYCRYNRRQKTAQMRSVMEQVKRLKEQEKANESGK
jgi:cytochrome c oxidase assembly protein subunit 20